MAMETNHTSAENILTQFIENSIGGNSSSVVNPSKLRYAVYARKSTLGDERQEKSIDDQITDCKRQCVDPQQLNVVQWISEKGSAKSPDVRHKFKKMLQDVKDGKIDGIITWHPDRLARNMKEAGEIIDLLDKHVIADLRFATSVFDNTPTGKMLLGISFVLSKQYSEHLSESVTRGNNRRTEDGEYIGKFKHGYLVTNDGHLQPDGENFALIRQAFEMRKSGQRLEDIAAHLNLNGYTKNTRGKGHEEYKWTKQRVSAQLLRDPVFCGYLWYGNAYSKLADFYDFEPAVSTEDFLVINSASSLKDGKGKFVIATKAKSKRETQADLMRGLVVCGACLKPYSSGITLKRKNGEVVKRYYYYKCETSDCEYKGKSYRASLLTGFISEFLDSHQFTKESNYKKYMEDYKSQVATKQSDLSSAIGTLTRRIAIEEDNLKKTKDTILQSDPEMKKYFQQDLIDRTKNIKDFNDSKNKLMNDRTSLKVAHKSYPEYLELFEKVAILQRSPISIQALDRIGRIFFSNLIVHAIEQDKKQGYEIEYKLKEPFAGFLKSNDFVCGRGERTRTFDLTVPNRARYQLRHTPMVLLE